MKLFDKMIYKIYFIVRRKPLLKVLKKYGMKYGENCKIQYETIIDESFPNLINFGNNVTVAPGVHILAHDASTKIFIGKTKIGKVLIGNNVFIGCGSIVLPNTNIEDNTIIAAGSIVRGKLEGGYVYGGIPCKKICTIDEYLKKMKEKKYISNYDSRKDTIDNEVYLID